MSDKKHECGETELTRLRRRVKELEAALALSSDNGNAAVQQNPLRDLATEVSDGLSGFLHAAAEQKDILESVLQSIDDGVIVANSKGEMVLFNRAARRLVGIGPVVGSENWAPRYGCYHTDGVTSYPSEELPLARAIRGETVRNEEVFVRNKDIPDGTLVLATATPIRNPHGTLAGGVVIFRDITQAKINQDELERRAAAIATAQSETESQKKLLEAVLDTIDIGVTVSNKQGEFVLFNAAARRILGVGPIAGVENWTPQYGCFRADGTTPFPAEELPLARALNGETIREQELYIRNPEIQVDVLLSVSATPFVNPPGDLEGSVCTFRDVTAEKLAQQTLEASEERFRAFMENLPAIAFIKDARGRYVYGNRHFFEYHPTTPQELERAVKTDFDLTATESATALQANDRKVLAGNTPLHISEQLIDFQGQPTWFSVYKFRLTSVSGDHLVGGIAVDVTERRRDEQQLVADEQLLRKLIDLQERERTLVAHDIHDGFVQDVVGAKMISETIADRLDSKKDEKSKGQFSAIDDALGRAIAEARRLISELRPMVIDEEGIVEAIRYLISDSQYSKETEITFIEKMGGMRLDSMLEGNLFRIVQEALNNAMRHSDAETVSIHLKRDEEFLTLTVADNGIGFHPEAADATRFGLRGIRERARLFDGTATINSAPGKGTQIEVKIPLLVPNNPLTEN